MSVALFNSRPGTLAAVDDRLIPSILHIGVEGWQGPTIIKTLINQVSLDSQVNAQLRPTFGGDIYIDIFGHLPSRFSLSGISLPFSCDNQSNISGIEYVLRYYERYNVTTTGLPLSITLGAARSLRVYLIGISARMTRPESAQWDFRLDMAMLPYTIPNRSLTNRSATSRAQTPQVSAAPAAVVNRVVGPIDSSSSPSYSPPRTGPRLDLISWGTVT